MALFRKKKDEEKKEGEEKKGSQYGWVLVKPLVTEKALILSGKRVYLFQVAPNANKIQVKKAVKEKYGVHPVKVNVLVQKARDFLRRGRKVHQPKVKKAMVFLKEGESIELV